MRYQIKLMNAVNEMGNALTAAEWPVKAVKVGEQVKIYDTKTIFKDLSIYSIEAEHMGADLRDCVNELCYKCGRYQHEHEGACDGCRWKAIKEALRT